METITFRPQNVCSREMTISYENGVIVDARIVGGCSGNLQGICKLIIGRPIEEVIKLLEGIKCMGGGRGLTSCPDQLAKGLKKAVM